ncbi:MAG TPA: hypothetical protein VJH03_23820 [Blastocatellia bacterium]|nr:hypothetical protein [Blastocatellia bacterium]
MAQVVIAGGVAATTVTAKSQVAPSVLLQFTGVEPTENEEPDGGLQATAPQVPLVAGA